MRKQSPKASIKLNNRAIDTSTFYQLLPSYAIREEKKIIFLIQKTWKV